MRGWWAKGVRYWDKTSDGCWVNESRIEAGCWRMYSWGCLREWC